MTSDDASIAYLPEFETGVQPASRKRAPETDPDAVFNRFCILLSETAGDVRLALLGLQEEARAMGMAIDALNRIIDTLKGCSDLLILRPEMQAATINTPADLARPLRLAASTALAVNAAIASSSNALAEASLRIIRAGEQCMEASRLAAAAQPVQPATNDDRGKAFDATQSTLVMRKR